MSQRSGVIAIAIALWHIPSDKVYTQFFHAGNINYLTYSKAIHDVKILWAKKLCSIFWHVYSLVVMMKLYSRHIHYVSCSKARLFNISRI